ncbi:MAG: MarC family protein [Elusimicrobiota bacterium]|jgi:multiple antibiotic resistance protein|nr:MarC family protein [Elusimicrobiota bacterium]
MSVDFSLVFSFFIAVLAILNPIGNVPIFLEHVNDDPNEVQKNIAKLMGVALFVISAFFYIVGQPFLKAFGITIPAFRIAGGILIMMIGIRMLNGKPKFDDTGLEKTVVVANPFQEATKKISSIIVPVVTPIFVGPGSIATVILFSQKAPNLITHIFMIFALACICALIAAVLYMSRWIAKILGRNGMQIVSRTMGLLLCAIAVQFVIDGISQLLPNVINPMFIHIK